MEESSTTTTSLAELYRRFYTGERIRQMVTSHHPLLADLFPRPPEKPPSLLERGSRLARAIAARLRHAKQILRTGTCDLVDDGW